ncbi:MAG: Bax inhibitor-1/YccA family protein [Clostridia bacterium]|nr:Bax inhibitor-1/YccA family protein [Clostridia bacterium]
MVLVFSFGFKKLSPKAVTALYYGYAILNGVTLSTIFIVYGIALIGKSFVMTSILFGALAYLGHSTDKDLTKMGTILLVALVVGLVATIVNLFMQSSMLSIILDWAMLFIFSGLTIYDMNKMKMMSQTISNDTASQEKLYIYCAMELYLDFINIFLRILRILGRANKK